MASFEYYSLIKGLFIIIFYTEWRLSRNMSGNFEELPVEDLSAQLRHFYGEVRKIDGTPYSKNALAGLRSALHRHITGPPWHRKLNIMHDAEFKAANNVLMGVLKQQKRTGQDKTKSFKAITPTDMQKLMESNVFGDESPQSLQDLVWFSIQFYLCRRGFEGSRELRKDSFVFQEGDENNPDFCSLKYHESSKNHPGGFQDTNDPQRRLHATGGPLCPVAALKLYISKLNEDCQSFYQRPNPKYSESGCWYLPVPLGIRKIQNMMSRLSQNAELSSKYTNHCVRAACVTTLMNSGYDPITVTRLSGHRNVASVMSYCRDATDDAKRCMGESLTSALNGSPRAQPTLYSSQRRAQPALYGSRPCAQPALYGSRPNVQPASAQPSSSTALQPVQRQCAAATLKDTSQITVSSSASNAFSSLFNNCTFTIGSFQVNNNNANGQNN